jgi:hypothetical protein
MFSVMGGDVDSVFQKIIAGRYLAGSNTYISGEGARDICASSDSVVIRSPITCKNPCCKMCYGDDPSTHRRAAITLPIGMIAAQSIGEPGTQLSMDSFKKGGVASNKGVTSAFEKLEAYTECKDLKTLKGFSSYDPVAWATGTVTEKYSIDGTKKITIAGSKISRTLPAGAYIRTEAVKGEGLCVERGDYDINELMEYAGLRTAQIYLIHTLYHIYKDEGEISMKHFEVLTAAMTLHTVISTARDDLRVGQRHDSVHMASGSLEHTLYTSKLYSVKSVQTSRAQLVSRFAQERVMSGLAYSLMLGLEDNFISPLNQITMGLPVGCGGPGDFLEERRV